MEHLKYINNVYFASDKDGKMICLVVKSIGTLTDKDGISRNYIVFLDPQRENTASQSRLYGVLTESKNTAVIAPESDDPIVVYVFIYDDVFVAVFSAAGDETLLQTVIPPA